MCGGGVHSNLLFPLMARSIETIDVCIWRMFVFRAVVVTVWGSVGMFVVLRLLLKIVCFFSSSLVYQCVSGINGRFSKRVD